MDCISYIYCRYIDRPISWTESIEEAQPSTTVLYYTVVSIIGIGSSELFGPAIDRTSRAGQEFPDQLNLIERLD